LITSRFNGWSQGIETCPVWLLEEDAARELLMRRSRRPDPDGADALAKKLDYLPLALEQAAAYIAQQEAAFGFADYVRLYDSFEPDLLRLRTAGATEYPDSVFLTWRATIDKLTPGARAMLCLAPSTFGSRQCASCGGVRLPCDIGFHDGIIQADREENRLFLPAFPLQCSLNLLFYPGTHNGVFGEHQEQLLEHSDRLVDAAPKFLADLQVFGSEPAAHALGLKARMEPLCKILIVG
jgi:hypothetical protein